MGAVDFIFEAGRAIIMRQRAELDQLDYRRELVRLASLGGTQRQLAEALGISQPSLSSALKTAQKVPPVRPGFSGADPYEVCQRYAVGQLAREQLVDELTRWEYIKPEPVEHGFFDDLRFTTPGSFDDVVRACTSGLIDGELYDILLDPSSAAPQ